MDDKVMQWMLCQMDLVASGMDSKNSGQCLQHFRSNGLRKTGLISEEDF